MAADEVVELGPLSPRDGAAIGTAGVMQRSGLWARLSESLRPQRLSQITHDVDVKDVVGVIDQVRDGKFSGRAVVPAGGRFMTARQPTVRAGG